MDKLDDKEYDFELIKKKLNVLYIYSINTPKTFKELLEESSKWDEDCLYVLSHTDYFDIKKLL